MRVALLMAAAAGVGAAAAFAVPASVLQSASFTIETYGAAAGQIPHQLADLNPIRLAFDVVQKRIREGNTPEQLGLKPQPVVLKPFVMPNGLYAQNPAGWHGTPPR